MGNLNNNGEIVKAYHYTNNVLYREMVSGEKFRGIRTGDRLVRLDFGGLPREAYEKVVCGLLEPIPDSWVRNPVFPSLWHYLIRETVSTGLAEHARESVLLEFDVTREDRAFVLDRSFVERVSYKKAWGFREPDFEEKRAARYDYFDSKVPVFEYHGGYDVPELVVWNNIPIERTRVVLRGPKDVVLQEAVEIWDQNLEGLLEDE